MELLLTPSKTRSHPDNICKYGTLEIHISYLRDSGLAPILPLRHLSGTYLAFRPYRIMFSDLFHIWQYCKPAKTPRAPIHMRGACSNALNYLSLPEHRN